MKNIAIIPARGGSKRIPRKNIKEFHGKPIIAYSIETALKSNLFDEVMVSTDDESIKEVALSYGAQVPFQRSEEASTDFATTMEVVLEVIERYHDMSVSYDRFCCLYPVAPFVDEYMLKKAYQKLARGNYDTVFPIVKYAFPIQRSLAFNQDRVSVVFPENLSKRHQDLEERYHDAGQFYWCDVEKILNKKHFFTGNTSAIVLPEEYVQDIDSEEDWRLAELKYALLGLHER